MQNRKSGWNSPLITRQQPHRHGPSIGQRYPRRAGLGQRKKSALPGALRLKDWGSLASSWQDSRSALALQGDFPTGSRAARAGAAGIQVQMAERAVFNFLESEVPRIRGGL